MKIGNASNPKVAYSKMVNKSKNTGNIGGRFAGSVQVNVKRIDEAKEMEEPNWYHMDLDDLIRAHTLCKDRVKAGEKYWIGVRSRIEDAIHVKASAKSKLQAQNKK
jgi:hypothetical protein